MESVEMSMGGRVMEEYTLVWSVVGEVSVL